MSALICMVLKLYINEAMSDVCFNLNSQSVWECKVNMYVRKLINNLYGTLIVFSIILVFICIREP